MNAKIPNEQELMVKALDEAITNGRFNATKAFEALGKNGGEINSAVRYFLTLLCNEVMVPESVAVFLGRYLAKRNPKKLLDPCAGLGSLALPVNVAVRPQCFDIFTDSELGGEPWKQYPEAKGINVHLGDGLSKLQEVERVYDAIVSCPPFGKRSKISTSVGKTEQNREIRGDYTHLVAVEACKHLSQNGVAIFIVTNSFFNGKGSEILSLLDRQGFKPTIAIELPPGSFSNVSASILIHMIVLERSNSSKIFTGRFSEDAEHQKTLLANIIGQTEGKVPEQGCYADRKSFRSFTATKVSKQLSERAERHGFVSHPFHEVVVKVNEVRKAKSEEGFKAEPNSFFLRRVGKGYTTHQVKDVIDKPERFFQLICNPEVANAEFLNGIFNTSFGQFWIESLQSGSAVKQITKESLHGSFFYLPKSNSLKVQEEVVYQSNKLKRLKTEIREIESRIWAQPHKIKETEKLIKSINKQDRYEDWLDSLPFPLASILWYCHTHTGNLKEKYERKIHFFEAMAQFIGVIQLSALSSSEEIWKQHGNMLNNALSKANVSLEMATFGTWSNILGFVGKKVRELLDKEAELIFEMFKTRNREFIQSLTSKKLVTAVKEVNTLRNNWVGHTGVVSDRDALKVNGMLDQHLQTVREVFGFVWEEFELLLPDSGPFVDGLFEYKAKRIMGTRTPFPFSNIKSSEAMEAGQLHLMDISENRGLKILPFVKVLPSPKTEETACYFYSRRDSKGIRFLSYYFEGESSFTDNFEDVTAVLSRLGN